MGLVDYSDSEGSASETEAPVKAAPKPAQPSGKKPFQKVVDRSNPGKIIVNLPSATSTFTGTHTQSDEPPTKRARTGGGGRFAGFNSFLPPPKNANKPKPAPASGSSRPVPAVSLKTSAVPGFSRDAGEEEGGEGEALSGGLSLPAPKPAQPSIPEEQKPEEEVKLVGKPLMFRPLSVARGKKKVPKTTPAAKAIASSLRASESKAPVSSANPAPAPTPAPVPKVSLFSLHTEEQSEPRPPGGAYEPLFATETLTSEYDDSAYGDYAQYANSAQAGLAPTTAPGTESLDIVADDLNLTPAQRRELFGRDGRSQGAKKVVNFNMDQEYQHNEELRAAGEQQTHNPVRTIQGGGKHSLQKLVQNVQSQREAFEDSFAKGKSNRKEASSRYGW